MATRVISTSIKLDGEAEFKKQLSGVNGELRNLKSEMQLTTAQFKGQANTVEALTAKDELLRREIAQQQEKVKALEQAVRTLGGLTEGNKLVGIISHVSALKTRIDRQIVVSKTRGGSSTVKLVL